jgi:hypothetical protein
MSGHGKLLDRNAHGFLQTFPSKQSIDSLVSFSIASHVKMYPKNWRALGFVDI